VVAEALEIRRHVFCRPSDRRPTGGEGVKENRRTYLRPYELRQGADELRRGVAVAVEGFFVDYLADGVPEG
jgi:hypothetical protein